ncbi:MAG: PorP/SprF family type IX secretion system membrane protein [Bacteroidota bacterium]
MTPRLLLFSLLLAGGYLAHAQQLSRYSMPWLDPVQFNPAYAGLDNSLSFTGAYRTQWTGLEGQPVGQRFSAHLPVYYLSSGFGVEVERDVLGARQLNQFGVSYNYQLVRGASVWSVGISARMHQLSLDGRALRTPDGIYEDPNTIIHNDDLLPTTSVSEGALGVSAGIYYQSENLEGGVSARNLNGPVIGFEGFDYTLGQQYHAYLKLRFELLRKWEIMPLAYGISDGTQTQLSFGSLFRYDENMFVGATYRGHSGPTNDAVVLLGGLNLSDKISIAYAYDVTLSTLQTVETGSHEVTLKYNLRQRIGAGVPPPVIFYPRTKE